MSVFSQAVFLSLPCLLCPLPSLPSRPLTSYHHFQLFLFLLLSRVHLQSNFVPVSSFHVHPSVIQTALWSSPGGKDPNDWETRFCGAGWMASLCSSSLLSALACAVPLLPYSAPCPNPFLLTLFFLVGSTPNVGLELMTLRLRVTCSTNWASRAPHLLLTLLKKKWIYNYSQETLIPKYLNTHTHIKGLCKTKQNPSLNGHKFQ